MSDGIEETNPDALMEGMPDIEQQLEQANVMIIELVSIIKEARELIESGRVSDGHFALSQVWMEERQIH